MMWKKQRQQGLSLHLYYYRMATILNNRLPSTPIFGAKTNRDSL
jgi:hypothetical protein